MLACINANGIRGFPMVPKADELTRKAFLRKTKGQRIGFVDLAPTVEMCELVSQLKGSPYSQKPIVYVDHHLSREYLDQRDRVDYLERELGSGARIRTRKQAGACAELVDRHHFRTFQLEAVAFHHCPDGFLSFLRGSGLSYPEILDDALLFERAKNLWGPQGKAQLSPIGKFLIRGMEVSPFPRTRSKGRLSKVHQHFQWICDWLKHGAPQSPFDERKNRIDQLYEQVRLESFLATEKAEKIAPDLISADLRPYDKKNAVVSRSIFRRTIIERFGPVTIATCRTNGHGDVMYVETTIRNLDLRRFAPKGITHHCPFRLTLPLSRFKEFVELWKKKS